MSPSLDKTKALLSFLKATSMLRRKRLAAYGSNDHVLWFANLPTHLSDQWKGACNSPFTASQPDDIADFWLQIRKARKPTPPPLPNELRDWVPQDFQANAERYIDNQTDQLLDILPQVITVLVEKREPHVGASVVRNDSQIEKVPEERRLKDYPTVQDRWLEYLTEQWEPWAEEMRQWRAIQEIYEKVDFMRRRLEEAEERYELILAIGLLQWRDSTGTTVKRHLLVAPAEIDFDAARGVLTVRPAATFETFCVELDMLDPHDQTRLKGISIEDKLQDLDVRAWDRESVGEILRTIANTAAPDAQVDENAWKPLERADEVFRILYAPALVLRERRSTAYEELASRLLTAFENGIHLSTTAPWEHFVSEGEISADLGLHAPDANRTHIGDVNGRLYFPLPTNDEQRQIAERLKTKPYVLVKGPPGTGKSHTIANLISHLLSSGERILVTAHAPKALTVLRDMLPEDIRSLCVTAVGSSREDHQLLEESVKGILARMHQWQGDLWARTEIERLEEELRQLEQQAIKIDRELRQFREAETYQHQLPGGYTGTAAQIAKRIEQEQADYSWFPELLDDSSSCPLSADDIAFLADMHAELTEERLRDLRLLVDDLPLPNADEFGVAVRELKAAEDAAKTALEGVREDELTPLQQFSDADLQALKTFLGRLEKCITRARRILEDLAVEIVKDLLAGAADRWYRLYSKAAALVDKMLSIRQGLGTLRIRVPSDVDDETLLADCRRRLEHFQSGGSRGIGLFPFFTPRLVRETQYIEKQCQVNGQPPRDIASLQHLCRFLELRLLLKELLKEFSNVRPAVTIFNPNEPTRVVDQVSDLVAELKGLLDLFKAPNETGVKVIPISKRQSLVEHDEIEKWHCLVRGEIARRRLSQAKEQLEKWRDAIRSLAPEQAHPCMAELLEAIDRRDVERWQRAWNVWERFKAERKRYGRYCQLVDAIRDACPSLARLVEANQGIEEWATRLRQLDRAWAWAAAKAWLCKFTDPGCYERLAKERQRLEGTIRDKVKELVAVKAWQAFFLRLDDRTMQNLVAWANAVKRIGKGTGKYAYRHRKAARKYLMACIPKIPAWIMPLHKLWETADPTPGLFDTVIVDEASQAGIEALILLLLAKRIIVVGDDMQNSPEAVGVPEDAIARLAHEHLRQFHFRDEFRPDTSLYDHAERAFGNVISLREHFRCVPEIIRFSNDLCYKDAPLIPLRQPPPRRLPPIKRVFVEHGQCEGDGQWIRNEAEAEEILQAIQACLQDPAYEGKTMGVIVLQGHAQAQQIEKMLGQTLEPSVLQKRRLRCGVPATFQGDERDVIFLSLVVAPNHLFRALTEIEARRRFNVAMSRARDQVWLFHSVKLEDLSRVDLRWQLINFFMQPAQLNDVYEELERLEQEIRVTPRYPGSQPAPYESWFEVDVAVELLRKHYRVRPQYQVGGYRIDLVIEGLDKRLAVECDGEAWHGPDRFDQDMARQRQLERAGWRFVRVRESEFYADRQRVLHRIIKACEDIGVRPVSETPN